MAAQLIAENERRRAEKLAKARALKAKKGEDK
jgi:hypothetical protein